uniref:Secreted protein n=1 Tax=Knipowitschia caucasica TaxID=637954 RepID=A0AAV2K4Q8_KNICA
MFLAFPALARLLSIVPRVQAAFSPPGSVCCCAPSHCSLPASPRHWTSLAANGSTCKVREKRAVVRNSGPNIQLHAEGLLDVKAELDVVAESGERRMDPSARLPQRPRAVLQQ